MITVSRVSLRIFTGGHASSDLFDYGKENEMG